MPSERSEVAALDIYGWAMAVGMPITLEFVESRLAELRGHRSSCRCGRCEWVRGPVWVRAVYRALLDWQEPLRLRCEVCGSMFTAKRRDARCCSAACRVAASRARRRG